MLELKRVPQKMSEDELENDTCLVLVNGCELIVPQRSIRTGRAAQHY